MTLQLARQDDKWKPIKPFNGRIIFENGSLGERDYEFSEVSFFFDVTDGIMDTSVVTFRADDYQGYLRKYDKAWLFETVLRWLDHVDYFPILKPDHFMCSEFYVIRDNVQYFSFGDDLWLDETTFQSYFGRAFPDLNKGFVSVDKTGQVVKIT